MTTKNVEFFFDFLSPYSYVAWTRIKNDISFDVEFFPVALAGLISHYETKGPGQIAPKRNYLMKDLLRFTKLHNIPFVTPPNLPFNSLYVLRLALKSVSGIHQKQVVDSFFKAIWQDGVDVGNSDNVLNILLRENLPASEWMDKISSKEVRLELKQNTELAIKKDVFGVPTFIYNKELFWGNDSIEYLKMHIEDKDPLEQKKYQEFLIKHPFNQ
jgi:2-hydroxychromene-2-carboxylate isomerase